MAVPGHITDDVKADELCQPTEKLAIAGALINLHNTRQKKFLGLQRLSLCYITYMHSKAANLSEMQTGFMFSRMETVLVVTIGNGSVIMVASYLRCAASMTESQIRSVSKKCVQEHCLRFYQV